jgi:hypothetical protein
LDLHGTVGCGVKHLESGTTKSCVVVCDDVRDSPNSCTILAVVGYGISGTSLSIPSWNQIASFLQEIAGLRETISSAA